MKPYLLLAVGAVIVGCGEPAAAPPEVKGVVTPAAEPAKQPLPTPEFGLESRLGLINGSARVKVGMDAKEALTVFGKPPSSWNTHDLPPSITGSFEAAGWQTKDEGFGMVLSRGRVAVAIYHLEKVSEEKLAENVGLHQTTLGEPTRIIPGKYVKYWFWQDGDGKSPKDQILMICSTEVRPGEVSVTESIGLQPEMEALGMTADQGVASQRIAEKLIDEQRKKSKSKSANSSNRGTS